MIKKIFIWLFCGSLLLPFLNWLLHADREKSEVENRFLNQKPAIPSNLVDWQDYPVEFESYFNDQVGFRSDFIQFYNNLLFSLGVSSNENIIVGKEGWLFHNMDDVFSSYSPERAYTQDDVKAWEHYIVDRRNWLKSKGIPYYFMAVPDKHAIYPEYLPLNHQLRMRSNNPVALFKALKQRGLNAALIDIYPAMLANKNMYPLPLYSRTDSHWNALGAGIANYVMMQKFKENFSEITPLLPEDMGYRVSKNFPGGGLAKMLDMQKNLREDRPVIVNEPRCMNTENYEFIENRFSLNSRKGRRNDHALQPYKIECGGTYPYKVLIFRDSFWDILRFNFSRHFGSVVSVKMERADFFNDNVLFELVEQIQPDIVVEERVYRFLPRKPVSHLQSTLSAKAAFQLSGTAPVSLMKTLKVKNTPYKRLDNGAVFFNKPAWKTEMRFSLNSDLVGRENAIKVMIDTQMGTSLFLILTSADGGSEVYDKVYLKKGLNTVYFKMKPAFTGFFFKNWQAAGKTTLLSSDVLADQATSVE